MNIWPLAALASALLAAPAVAADSHGAHGAAPPAGAAASTTALADGEIRKVDKAAKKLTIRHGPLVALDMPAMTMVFQVRDAAVLEQLKPGDKVKFEAQKAGTSYVVTRIQPAE